MATRPDSKLEHAIIVDKLAKNTVAFKKGVGVKFGASDDEVDLCAAGDQAIGIALETKTGDGTKRLKVCLLAGGAVVPVLVGDGGTATRGAYAECGTDGFTNRTPGGGTTLRHIAGVFTQSGVADDEVGLMIAPMGTVSS